MSFIAFICSKMKRKRNILITEITRQILTQQAVVNRVSDAL